MIFALETSVGGIDSPSFWVLMVPIIALLGGAVANYINTRTAAIHAKMAKDKAEEVATNLLLDRELSRKSTEKIDRIATQTDGRLSEVIEANKLLRDEMVQLKQALAVLQGRELERKDIGKS